MAWSVAVYNSSSFPIVASTGVQQPNTGALHVGSSFWSRRASLRTISSTRIRTYIATHRLDSSHLIRAPSRELFVILPFHSDVNYCPQTLTGYWVGPDTEDGWGFVEAYIGKNM